MYRYPSPQPLFPLSPPDSVCLCLLAYLLLILTSQLSSSPFVRAIKLGHGIGHLIAVATSVTCEACCASTPGTGLKPRTLAQQLKGSGQLHGGQIWSVHI